MFDDLSCHHEPDSGLIQLATPLKADDCIAMLSGAGLFDEAFASADVQMADKTVVFDFLVARCIEMTGMSDEAIR
jgi:hypothetical protein